VAATITTYMAHNWKWAALIVLAPSLVFAQSANLTTAQKNESLGAATVSSTAITPQLILPDSTSLEFVYTQKADYPLAAERDGIQGEVMVRVNISETGDVESTEVLSGNPILADAAVRAAKKFKFKPFIRSGEPIKVATKLPFDFYFRDKVLPTNVPVDSNKTEPSGTSASAGTDVPKRVKVSAGVTTGLLIRKIQPVYPHEAKLNHIQGSVVMRAIIGKDGRIKDLTPISGPKELIPPSIGAVQQWVYKPYLLLGEPVEVDTQITVNYTLSRF